MDIHVKPHKTEIYEKRMINMGTKVHNSLPGFIKEIDDYPLSYRVPAWERYGSTLLPATREQHDQNCTQSH